MLVRSLWLFWSHDTARHSHTSVQKTRAGYRPWLWVRASAGGKSPHLIHTHTHTHTHTYLSFSPLPVILDYQLELCRQHYYTRKWHLDVYVNTAFAVTIWSKVPPILCWVQCLKNELYHYGCLCSKKCTWLFWLALFSIVNLGVRLHQWTSLDYMAATIALCFVILH